MRPLRGVGVLVTRPQEQAAALCQRLESAGAQVSCLPAISILGIGKSAELKARVGPIDAFDLVIFTSANAVRHGNFVLDGNGDLPLAAIGPATARALEATGRRVRFTPSGRFDSEGLLADASLAQPLGRRILLVKGMDGRELLQDELTRRGAQLVVADVYRRERAMPGAAEMAAVAADIAAGALQVITATSVEIVASLLDMKLRPAFERLHWLVPGARVAAALRERGVTAPTLLADSADDQDLVAALVRWRSSASGA